MLLIGVKIGSTMFEVNFKTYNYYNFKYDLVSSFLRTVLRKKIPTCTQRHRSRLFHDGFFIIATNK